MSRESGGRGFDYPKSARLRRRREFLAVQRSGVRQHTRHFVVIARAGREAGLRLGVTASKKVGNAVTRNRWKRVVREAFRQVRAGFTGGRGYDIVVIARKGVEPPDPQGAERELRRVVRGLRSPAA